MAKPRQSRLRRVELSRAREAAGLTQEAFAASAGVEVSTVVRWESGCTTPLPGKRPQIARVLGIGLHELERLLSPDGSPALAGIGSDAFSAAGAAGAARTWAQSDNGGLAAIAGVREEIAKLAFEHEVRPTIGLVVPAAGLLRRVEALRGSGGQAPAFATADRASALPGAAGGSGSWSAAGSDGLASGPDAVTGNVTAPAPTPLRWRRDLDIAEAEAALLVGRLLWGAAGRRDPSAAEEYFQRAARRAAQGGDSVLQASATLRSAFLGLYGGDPRTGVRRSVRAAAIAAPVSQALFALARLHTAEGHALLGNAAECDRALATARGAMAATDADDPVPGVCPPRTYHRLAGAAHLALGRYAEARAALTEAADLHEPGKVLAVVLGHLALACLGEGDMDAALRHLRPAIDLAEATRSAGALAVASRAGREIVRVAGGAQSGAQPGALEVVDRLLAALAAC